MAMKEGLSLAYSLGLDNVEAESDSLEVINFCTGQSQWWDSAAAIYAECVDLANLIGKVKFKHCNRVVNGVAHELAKFSFLNKHSGRWDDDPPSFLLGGLANDVIII
ncbi:hypothetical protein VPH35_073426 [Triticum aestivum]